MRLFSTYHIRFSIAHIMVLNNTTKNLEVLQKHSVYSKDIKSIQIQSTLIKIPCFASSSTEKIHIF